MATMQQTRPWRPSNFPASLRNPAPNLSDIEGDDEMVSIVGQGSQYDYRASQQVPEESNHMTKSGYPDRRYRGQRDLPESEVVNPGYRRATNGAVVQGRHVTKDGSPDRRYKENRAITDDEAEIRKAENILAKHGRR